MYHFISGYTAKVAGTEVGVTEPQATFSACFGAPFLVWHPAEVRRVAGRASCERHGATAWLVNTGWSGGPYGVGQRLSIEHTRAIIDAIHSASWPPVRTAEDPIFGLSVPTQCSQVPDDVLLPRRALARQERL